jgi:putative heme-binding domain-containing protein
MPLSFRFLLLLALTALPLAPVHPAAPPSPLTRALPLLDDPTAQNQQALLRAVKQDRAGPAAAVALLRVWLAEPALVRRDEHRLQALLEWFVEDEKVESFVAAALASPTTSRATRLRLLRALAALPDKPPQSVIDAVGKPLAGTDPLLRREALATIRALGFTSFDARLQALWKDTSLPTEWRITALAYLAPRLRSLPDDAFNLLSRHLAAETPPLLRLGAARAMGAARLDAKQLVRLARSLLRTDPTAAVLVLPAFARSRDRAVGLALAGALRRSACRDLLTEEDLDRLFIGFPDRVRAAARPLLERAAERGKAPARRLDRVAADLPAGDAERGRAVFFSERSHCTRCHSVKGSGGTLGPNLSRIGLIRGQRELLRSIVLPSAHVSPEFRPFTVTLDDGRVATGLLLRESAQALYLRSPESPAIRLPKSRIEDIRLSGVSLMPDGFDRVLGRQELADLLAFLGRLR